MVKISMVYSFDASYARGFVDKLENSPLALHSSTLEPDPKKTGEKYK